MRHFRGFFSRYSAIALQFVGVAIITRQLAPNDAAMYFAVFGTAQATYVWAGFGIPDALVRRIPQIRVDRGDRAAAAHARTGMLRASAWALLGAFVFCGVSAAIWQDITVMLSATMWWLAYAFAFIAGQGLVALRREQLGSFVFYAAIGITTTVALVTALLIGADATLGVYLVAASTTALATGAGGLAIALHAARDCSDITTEPGTALFRIGMPLVLSRGVVGVLIWIPTWAANAMLEGQAAADLVLAARLLSAIAALMAAVRFSVRSEISGLAAEGDWPTIAKQSSKIASIALIFAFVASVGVMLLGPTLIPLVFGDPFALAWLPLSIMCVAVIAESVLGPVDEVLKMSGQATTVLLVQAAVALACAAVSFSPLAGDNAPLIATAYSLSFVLMFGAYGVVLRRTRGVVINPLGGWK